MSSQETSGHGVEVVVVRWPDRLTVTITLDGVQTFKADHKSEEESVGAIRQWLANAHERGDRIVSRYESKNPPFHQKILISTTWQDTIDAWRNYFGLR